MDRRSRNDGVATGSTSAERSNPASRPPSHHLPSSSGPGRASDPRSQQRKWSSTRHQSSYARQSRDFTWGGSYGHHWISKNDRYSLRSKRLISPRRSPSPVKNDRKSREGSYLKRRNGSYYRSRSPTRRSEPKRIKEEPLEPHSLVKEELLDMPLEVPPIVDNSPPMTTVKVEIETIAAATSNSVQCTTDGHPPIKEEPPEADKKQAVHRLVLYSSSEASSQCPLNPEEMPFSEEAENHGTMAYDDAVAESTMEEGEVLLVDELKSSVVIDPTTLAISDAIHRGFSEFLYTSLPHDEFMPVPPPTPESTRTISPVPPPSAASFHRTPPHILNLLHFGPTGCPSSPPPPSENGPSGQQAHASTSSTPHSSHRSHPSSSATHRPNQQHPKGHAKSYKLVRDMALGQEANVKRVYGRCNDNYSKYNLPPDFPMTDPRKRIFKPQQCDLPLLHFKLDDNWTGRLFRREVSIFNLNDNVNRAFLERMAEKYEVEEIAVIFNPQTSRHLGMAFLFFKRALTAEAFVDANNDKSVMGSAIRCVFDPFASQLYDCFSNVAPDCAFPKFNYLKDMSDLHLMRLRDEILGKRAVVPPPVEPLGPISPELQDSLAQARYSKAVPPGRDPRLSGYPHRHDSVDERDGRRHSLENPRVPSTSVPPPMKSPPPPYSEMLPMGHEASNLPSTSRGSDSQKRSATDEVHSRREKKPRRSSSMSSSEEEIRGRRDAGRRRKGDTTPPTDVETIKFTTSARVYSSERKPNGDKKVVEETTTTLYHRKEITRKSSRSPDSFEEEMKRREESEKRKTKKSRRNRDGQIGFHWSSNESSDSDKDGEIGRRRRGREAPRHGDGSRQRSDGGSNMSTPVKSGQSVPSTPSRRGFQAPPAGSSIPPPGLVHIPPVGVVDPVPASPHPPPQPWHPSMASAPPPLPGTYMSSTVTPVHRGGARCYEDRWGPSASSVDRWSASPGDPRIRPRSRFIRKSMSFAPPPRFDGGRRPSASTSGKSGFIPPPMWFGYGFPPPMIYPPPMGQSPMGQPPTVPLTFVTPPPPPPCTPNTAALRLLDEATKAKQFVQDLQPEKKPKLEEGSPVRHSAAATSSQQCVASPCPGSAEKKSIDDRLSSIFGLQKKALVDTSIPRNNTSAPHLAGYGTEVKMERPPSVEIRNDDMDVADSDEEKPVMMKKMTDSFSHLPPFQMEQARTASLVSDCNFTTMAAVHSTVNELQQVINNDLWKKMDMWAMEGIDEWMQQAKKEEEEKKREQIRLSMETADPTLLTPRKDIMQAILEEKLKSPEKMAFMPKLNMPKFIRVQKPVLSRENTPLERIESRGSTRSRSTLSTSSSATDEEEEESEKSSEEEDEDLIELKKRRKNRAPKMKNITSSADSSAVHSEAEEGGYAKGKDSNHFCRAGPSTPPEEEVDFDGPPDPALRSHPAPKDSIDLVIDDVLKVQLQEAAKASPKKPPKKNDYVPKELLNLIPTSTTIEKTFKKLVKTFAPRSNEEEDRIYRNFMAGMDGEDNDILCKVLNTMQEGGKRPFVITSKSGESRQFPDEVPFAPFIRAFTPCELARAVKVGKVDNFFDDNELEGIVPHRTGCARTEGFYRWTNRQKTRIMRRPEGASERAEITDRDEIATRHQVQACKEQRSMNRRLMTLMDSNFSSDFFKVNQLKYRKKMIKFARSKIHGWGLYALEPIAPDDMIVEYVGQKVRPIIADEREKAYEKRGIGSSYLFRIDEHEVIDATKMGNFARFINHSCQPNCYAKVVTMDGDKRIVIYSKRLIEKGEEITYDYKFPIENDKVPCLCGAPTCRGFLN